MIKRQFLILTFAGFFSFFSVFAVNWFLASRKAAAANAAGTPAATAAPRAAGSNFDFAASAQQGQAGGMTERQLQNLIQDIRVKAKDYKDRQAELDTQEQRIAITSQSLQNDIDKLSELRDKLVQIQTAIEDKQAQLKQSVLEIEQLEQKNFKRLAATYEKMDSTQASRIMVNMAASNQLQDSVKILYYMNERMAAKLLAEIAAAKPELASVICMQLKYIKEST